MHTVELLEQALAATKQLGIRVRQEWMSGQGGLCEFKGKRWLFLDPSAPPAEQLGLVLDALRQQPGLERLNLAPELAKRLQLRHSA